MNEKDAIIFLVFVKFEYFLNSDLVQELTRVHTH